ncbi:MAG: alkaline phosphatase family protein [candidate division Zixibacteria bacterium]|nr:alkaline phosphatase family protein [candidate division Zixibacteria bacterium]
MVTVGVLVAAVLLIGQTGVARQSSSQRPKAAVVIVIDQMRADYVTRFTPYFTGGLKRILSEGAVFDSASHEHANTETAVGHATLSTGCFPSHHGIVGNEFYDRLHDQIVYAVEDTTTRLLRTTSAPLKRDDSLGSSAHYLLRSSIANWVAQADKHNRVFSISLKDRSAILMAGQSAQENTRADAVYWWDRKTGDFVTSTAYAQALPEWVNRFNRSGARDNWRDSVWNRIGDTTQYDAIGPDSVALENDGIHTAFPHRFTTERGNRSYYDALYYTPYADQLLIGFARELIRKEKPGKGKGFDLLMISCSAADAVGHSFGPMSQEIFDHYLRLDKCLDTLIRTLDSALGRDNYVIALSSDHGCANLPPVENRISVRDYQAAVLGVAKEAMASSLLDFRRDSVISFLGSDLIIRRNRLAPIDSANESLLIRALTWSLDKLPFVLKEESAETIRMLDNNFYPGRMPDISVILKENLLLTSSTTGTGHGTPYWYDRHVPLAFWGVHIKPQHLTYRVRTVDMAPTLADLIGIAQPDSVDGVSLFRNIRE